MFSVPTSPLALVGKRILLPGDLEAEISQVFNLASGQQGCDEAWVAEICVPLRNRECLFDPNQGISLTGKRWVPLSEMGRSIWVID